MAQSRQTPLIWLWTTAALAGLAWGLLAVVFAAIAPATWVPRLFWSYHIEHFAAFYLIAVLAAAGLPMLRLRQVGFALVLMALLLAAVRLAIPHHRLADAEDLAADIAGIGAAIVPIVIGRLREAAAQRSEAETSE
jgi:hypothetical protein